MGKTLLNTALAKISGRIDNWVYRRRHGQLIVAKRPDFSEVVPTANQLAARERFNLAAAYGRRVMADPVQRAFYAAIGDETGNNAFAEALTDFLKPPTVTALETAGYHGQIGDPIGIAATDTHGVTAVAVTIRNAANAVLEQGAAVLTDGTWTYTATTAIAAATAVTIEAVATDRPGQTGTLAVPLVVG